MMAQGFGYTPYAYVDSSAAFGQMNPLNEGSLEFGYEDPPQEAPQDRSHAEPSAAYSEALSGDYGCANRARGWVYGAPSAAAAAVLAQVLIRSADSATSGYATTTESQTALSAWSSCMSKKGYDFASPDAARLRFAGDGEISAEELAVRRADFDCDRDSGLTESRSRFESASFAAWIDSNATAIQELITIQAEAARELISLRTQLETSHDGALPTIPNALDAAASTLPQPQRQQ